MTLDLDYATMTPAEGDAEAALWSSPTGIPAFLWQGKLGFFALDGPGLATRPLRGLLPNGAHYLVTVGLYIETAVEVTVTAGASYETVQGPFDGPVLLHVHTGADPASPASLTVSVTQAVDFVSQPYLRTIKAERVVVPWDAELALNYATMTTAQLTAEAELWTSPNGTAAFPGRGGLGFYHHFGDDGLAVRRLDGVPTYGSYDLTVDFLVDPGHGTVTLQATGSRMRTFGAGRHTVTLEVWPDLATPTLTVGVTAQVDFLSSPTIFSLVATRSRSRAMPVVLEIFRTTGTGFRLDMSVLGDALGMNGDVARWQTMLAEASSVQMTRGGELGTVGVSAQVGTLSVTLVNAFDLQTIQAITPDSPVRLSHPSGRRIYTGNLRSIRLGFSFDKTSGKKTIFTYLTAVDKVRTLGNTMRYGAVNGGSVAFETWEARIARLMRSSSVAYTITGNGDDSGHPLSWRRLQDIVYESNLINHLDMACVSVQARWFVDVNNRAQFYGPIDGPSFPVRALLTDDPTKLSAQMVMPYTDIDVSYDTETLVNDIKVINHGRKSEDGRWVASDITYGPYQDATSVQTWGAEAVTIDTSLWITGTNTAPIDEVVATIFATQRSPRLTARSAVLDARKYGTFLSSLDLYQRLSVEIEGVVSTVEIISIRHSITPNKWLCTLNFKDVA